jgi:chemotaxis signal transduction protein
MNFLTGMGKSGNKFVLLLDIDRVLSATDLDNPAALSAGATEGTASAID